MARSDEPGDHNEKASGDAKTFSILIGPEVEEAHAEQVRQGIHEKVDEYRDFWDSPGAVKWRRKLGDDSLEVSIYAPDELVGHLELEYEDWLRCRPIHDQIREKIRTFLDGLDTRCNICQEPFRYESDWEQADCMDTDGFDPLEAEDAGQIRFSLRELEVIRNAGVDLWHSAESNLTKEVDRILGLARSLVQSRVTGSAGGLARSESSRRRNEEIVARYRAELKERAGMGKHLTPRQFGHKHSKKYDLSRTRIAEIVRAGLRSDETK
jgi:hypothetical protein